MKRFLYRLKADYSFNNRIKLFILNSFISYIVMAAMTSVLQGIYFKAAGFGEVFIGNVIAIRTVMTGLGSIPVGLAADRIGRRNTLLLGVIMNAAGYLGQSIFLNENLIYLFAGVNGLGMAIMIVNEAPFLVENCEEKKRINLFSINFVMTNLAFVIGAFSAGKLPELMGGVSVMALRNTQIAFSAFAFMAIIPLSKIKNTVFGFAKPTFTSYIYLIKNRKISLIILYNLMIGFGAGLVVPFFNIFLQYRLRAGTGVVGQIMGYAQIATVLGGIAVPFVAKRFGRGFTVQFCQVLSIPFLLTISAAGSVAAISICFFMRNALMNMANPAVQSLTMEVVEDCDRSAFSGMTTLTSHITRGISASLAGFIMANISYEFPYYITSALYILAIIIFSNIFDCRLEQKYVKSFRM